MTKFIAYVEQEAGCDYTIACGCKLWELKAENLQDALAEVKLKVIGEWDNNDGCYYEGYDDDYELKSVTLYEVASTMELPVAEWYSIATTRWIEATKRVSEMEELAELERLKAKYPHRALR